MRTHRVFALTECTALSRIVPASPPRVVMFVVLLLVSLVTGVVLWAAMTEADLVIRAPARVRARTAPQLAFSASSGERVVAPTGGKVRAVAVREGMQVQAGDKLATLDTQQLANDLVRLEAALVAARSARDATQRMDALATEQFEAAQATRNAELAQAARDEARGRTRRNADIALARASLDAARRDLARIQALEADGAASQAQREQAQSKVLEASARLDAALVDAGGGRARVLRSQIAQAERDFAVRREEIAQELSRNLAEVAAAEQRVANARLELGKAAVIAETSGVVSAVSVVPGDVVQPGQAMFVVSPRGGLRVDAAVAASDVGRIRAGMPVRIRVDAFDWQRYGTASGEIEQISPDAEPLEGTGGRAIVYTVRIRLDSEVLRGERGGQLKLGMTGTVEIITERQQLLSILLGGVRQAFSLGG